MRERTHQAAQVKRHLTSGDDIIAKVAFVLPEVFERFVGAA